MTASTGTRSRVSGDLGNGLVTLYVLDCANCGVVFGINVDYEKRRRNDGQTFYCPNGHSNVWHETAADRERRRVESLTRMLACREEDLRIERISHAATKGKLTKTKKRADAGTCQHCHRTFQNVARHVATKHAEAAR